MDETKAGPLADLRAKRDHYNAVEGNDDSMENLLEALDAFLDAPAPSQPTPEARVDLRCGARFVEYHEVPCTMEPGHVGGHYHEPVTRRSAPTPGYREGLEAAAQEYDKTPDARVYCRHVAEFLRRMPLPENALPSKAARVVAEASLLLKRRLRWQTTVGNEELADTDAEAEAIYQAGKLPVEVLLRTAIAALDYLTAPAPAETREPLTKEE